RTAVSFRSRRHRPRSLPRRGARAVDRSPLARRAATPRAEGCRQPGGADALAAGERFRTGARDAAQLPGAGAARAAAAADLDAREVAALRARREPALRSALACLSRRLAARNGPP